MNLMSKEVMDFSFCIRTEVGSRFYLKSRGKNELLEESRE